jgi:hypothetical protein
MEYKDAALGVSFTIPDKLTVRQQMQYDGAIGEGYLNGLSMYERFWQAARLIIQDWQCDYIALDADLDKLDDRQAAQVVEFAGRAAFSHVIALERTPKNS